MEMERQKRGNNWAPLAQINITPLVDVILVMLIIFMVTASMGQQGITVNLPKAKASPMAVANDLITVSIDSHLQIFINTNAVSTDDLTAKLSALYQQVTHKTVFLKADKAVPYGDFIRVVSLIKAAGVEQLGMITDVPNP